MSPKSLIWTVSCFNVYNRDTLDTPTSELPVHYTFIVVVSRMKESLLHKAMKDHQDRMHSSPNMLG